MQHITRTFTTSILSFLISGAIWFSASSAAAQSDPCEKDSAKYCNVFKGADPRKYYCLNQVYNQLSNDCKMAVKKMTSVSSQEFKDECRDDYKKFCTDTLPGAGKIVACLKKHSKEVSFECRKVLADTPQ